MPNWCSNDLRIRGTKQSVINFINKGLGTLGAHADTLEDVGRLISLYGMYNQKTPLQQTQPDTGRSTSYTELPYRVTYFGLSAFLPMPELFHRYDTTNNFISRYEKGTKEYYEELSEFEAVKNEQKEKYGVVGWYDWNCANYGCKWDVDINFVDYEENGDDDVELHLCLDTPWSPCDAWLETMQNQNRDVRFWMVSEEPGMVFKYEYMSEDYDADARYFADVDDVEIYTYDMSEEYAEELQEECEEWENE